MPRLDSGMVGHHSQVTHKNGGTCTEVRCWVLLESPRRAKRARRLDLSGHEPYIGHSFGPEDLAISLDL